MFLLFYMTERLSSNPEDPSYTFIINNIIKLQYLHIKAIMLKIIQISH
jgi:hypothetical protein